MGYGHNKRAFRAHPDKGCEGCQYWQQVPKREWWGCFCGGDGYFLFGQPVKSPCPDREEKKLIERENDPYDPGDSLLGLGFN